VAKGQKVILAGVGTTVFPLDGEPFEIKESKIRGELSEGMICAEDEIGLGKSHEGILVLPSDAEVGILAKEYFNLQSDSIFEIGLTPNRSDAASHLGVARDIAAFLRKDFKMPDVSTVGFDDSQNKIKVSIEDTAACPRYTSLTIKGITVKES